MFKLEHKWLSKVSLYYVDMIIYPCFTLDDALDNLRL